MKILITDGLSPKGQQILTNAGIDFHIEFFELPDLIKIIPEYDGILVRSATKVPKEVIDAATNLKAIARAGAGIDNIDSAHANSKNIPVLNTPGANSASVAELVVAHMFALARFIPQSNITMRNGKWEKKSYKGFELAGKTLGIIGFGKIGQILAKKALGLDMTVQYFDVVNVQTDLDVKKVSFDDILATSDILSLHTPKQAKPLLDKETLSKVKNRAYLINCARGGVVDEVALLEALESGKLAGAGIDVYEDEPTHNTALINHPNVSVTPHIGASTNEAQDRVGLEIAEKIVKTLI